MRPMLATPGPQPVGHEWTHEVKWDGIRVIATITDKRLRLTSRTERDITATFPDLAAITGTVSDAVIDGEIIAMRDGRPSFTQLAERMHIGDARKAAEAAEQTPVVLMAFDLVRLYGVDLIERPLTERRTSLDHLELPDVGYQRSPWYPDGPALFAATRDQGMEGVVAKRLSARYQPGRRSPDWVKTSHQHYQACVVGGWRTESTVGDRLGSLLVGIPSATGLQFVGRVGSGLSAATARTLRVMMLANSRPDSPFADELEPADTIGTNWCDPVVVVEVRYLQRGNGGRLRHPVFRGIRTDLSASEVRDDS